MSHLPFSTLLTAAANAIRSWIARSRRNRRERQAHVALSHLDTHTLRDLGIHRSEIASLAREMTTPRQRTRVRAGFAPLATGFQNLNH